MLLITTLTELFQPIFLSRFSAINDRTELEWKLEGSVSVCGVMAGFGVERTTREPSTFARSSGVRSGTVRKSLVNTFDCADRMRTSPCSLNPEFGTPHEIPVDESTIVRCHPETAAIRFHLHPTTGRLWITAIDTVAPPSRGLMLMRAL
jgi:hypothetical protein